MAKVGRPMIYKPLIEGAEDEELYSPAKLAMLGVDKGLIEEASYKKARHSLARFQTNNGFPEEGDGTVFLQGRQPTPGWFGWRWRAALKE